MGGIKKERTSHHRLTPSSFLNSLAPMPLMMSFFLFLFLAAREESEEKYALSLSRLKYEAVGEGGKDEREGEVRLKR